MDALRHLALVAALAGAAGCGRPPADVPEDARVLATLGTQTITAGQFELAYAFGHAHLRDGDPATARRAFLDLMLAEAALALEAERVGLAESPAVRASMRTLGEELLVEHVFDRKVLDAVTVTDAEVEAAVNRAAVSFQFRFLPASDLEDARALRAGWQAVGFEAAVAERADGFGDLGVLRAEDLTSPLMTADQVEPAVLATIQDLEVARPGQPRPSAPVETGGRWLVFEVVDVQRRGVADTDYVSKRESVETVLFNEKALDAGAAFVDATMTPLDVRTRRPAFDALADALWDWYRLAPPTRPLLTTLARTDFDAPFARDLRALYGQPLVEVAGDAWTVRDWLDRFSPGRYTVPTDRGEAAFRARLSDVVALVVRDDRLMAMARAEGLDRDPAYRQRVAWWRRSVLYGAYRAAVADSLAPADLEAVYARADARLGGGLRDVADLTASERLRLRDRVATDRLRERARRLVAVAEVDEALLASLDLDHVEARPRVTFTLVNSNSNRPPFPAVDPRWRAAPGAPSAPLATLDP